MDKGFDLGNGISTGEAQVIVAATLIAVSLLAAGSAFAAFLETRRTRKQAIRPVIALDLASVTEMYAEVGITNVGQGAATDLDLELAFLPGEATGEPVRRRWNWPLIQPGQRYQFAPPTVGEQPRPDLEVWAALYPSVTLTGTVRDQLGHDHSVDVAITDLPGLRDRAMDAGLASLLRETAEQRALKGVVEGLKAIATAIGRRPR